MTDSITLKYSSSKMLGERKNTSMASKVSNYILTLFPIFKWIHHYNVPWLVQDSIAGITVGMLLVPQAIAYAKVANLDPQYGLYSSIFGVVMYCLFGTSKDVSIGPITVVSLLVGQAVTSITTAHPDITGPQVAVCLSLFAGMMTSLMGFARLGLLVDFIAEPVVAGYTSGSAITIGFGQWPAMFGMTQVSTRNPPYKIFIDFFKNIVSDTHIDVAFGMTALVILYAIKFGTAKLSNRYPQYKGFLFYLLILRSALVVMVGTLISYFVNIGHDKSPYKIIGTVPAGLQHVGIPNLNPTILKESSGVLPSIILIMVLEHVSVAKSFGTKNGYTPDANQEMIAIGVSNMLSSFIGGYPSTGAFSRTAIMSRSGSKTPLAGVFSGAIVLLALYVLTPAFYYIPQAVLSAIVIHAVSDLVSGPKYLQKLRKTGMLELAVFLVTVGITVFHDVETAIYAAVGLSLVILLVRIARPSVISLAMVPVSPQQFIYVNEYDPNFSDYREQPPAGIVTLRLCSSILYPNAGHIAEEIARVAKTHTASVRPSADAPGGHELSWDQAGEKGNSTSLYPLRAVVLDFAAVLHLDATAIHAFDSVRATLDHHAGRKVEWHFTNLQNPVVRQLLIDAGFGLLGDSTLHDNDTDLPPSHPSKGEKGDTFKVPEIVVEGGEKRESAYSDPIQSRDSYYAYGPNSYTPIPPPMPTDEYPCFHWDMDTAVQTICERWDRLRPATML